MTMKLQNLIHVFETMTELQPILEGNFGEDYDFMLDDYDDSIIDLCDTIMKLILEGERPNDISILNKVYEKLYSSPLSPVVLQQYKSALLNLTIQN